MPDLSNYRMPSPGDAGWPAWCRTVDRFKRGDIPVDALVYGSDRFIAESQRSFFLGFIFAEELAKDAQPK